jgi:replicative DNA helicase
LTYLPERDLLVLLLAKENYHNFFEYLDQSYLKDNYKELYYIYSCLQEVHEIIPTDIGLDSLQAYFFQTYPDVDKDIYLGLFKTLQETKIDATLGVALLNQIKSRRQALKLSEAAFKYSSGNGTYEDVSTAVNRFTDGKTNETEEFEFVTTSLSTIISDIFQKPGLRWRLNALNKSLGSLRKGNFGFLFARPEVGKTTFLASEISFMLSQLTVDHGPIVWFNNEQVGAEVMLRLYQGYFGVRLEQIKANPKKYETEFNERTQGKFKLVDNANVTRQLVEKILKQFNPSLVVFDQIDKIKGFAADREDLRLGAIYIWARELAKEYCPVVGICQADGTGENVKWLTMDHVANAKTSKQAEADWILGMGAIHSEGMQFIRYLNISKNKLMGDDDTIPRLRHGKFEVLIEPEIARFRDLIEYT